MTPEQHLAKEVTFTVNTKRSNNEDKLLKKQAINLLFKIGFKTLPHPLFLTQ